MSSTKKDKKKAIEKLRLLQLEAGTIKLTPGFFPKFDKWRRDVRITICNLFPANPETLSDYNTIAFNFELDIRIDDSRFQQAFCREVDRVVAVLESMIEEIRDYWPDETGEAVVANPPSIPSIVRDTAKRFRVALSFAGERRSFVAAVADALTKEMPKSQVFYDKWYEAELTRPNLDTYLQKVYRDDSELIAFFVDKDYEHKQWCGLEWRAVRDLLKHKEESSIMPFRFDGTQIPGLLSIDGYIFVGDRPPKEIAALILKRIEGTDTSLGNRTGKPEDKNDENQVVVSSSRGWVMLANYFYEAASVRSESDGRICMEILSTSSEDDATIRALQTSEYGSGKSIAFAHGHDGLLVRVQSVGSASRPNGNLWTIHLISEKIEYGGSFVSDIGTQGFSADDIAKMRAERILLNHHKSLTGKGPINRAHVDKLLLDGLIAGINVPVPIHKSPLPDAFLKLKTGAKERLEIARLLAIFLLKAGGVVEHVLELSLGPIVDDKIHVKFRGRRRKIYTNADAIVFEIEGDCSLAEAE